MAWLNCVGLEVHVQLRTASKMFCSCSADFGGQPNSRCCPVCLGLPGSLPMPNRQAIEYVIRTGLALSCRVADRCRFARKNYFYPDLPKNYQISQYDEPLTFGGHIELDVDGEAVGIRIRRAHLEEDTGKNIHLADGRSVVDYNRCGVPLMEVVTEPDFATAEQVRAYLLLLRQTLRYLGVSDADMEKGQMRCEPTVNLVDPEAGQRTPRVEIKNLNSMRSVYEAVRYELARQRRCLETGEEMFQETRRWDEAGAVTATMRRKETADDYMYFPDPDLVPLMPERAWVEAVAASLPELPGARRRRFMDDYGLPAYDAGVLTEEAALAGYFEAVAAAAGDPKAAANRVMVEVLREGEPKARLTQLAVEVLVRKAPELPAARQGRFVTQYGLPADEAGVLAAKADLAKYYEEVAAAAGDPKAASNWVMTEVLRVLNEHGIGIAEFRLSVPPAHIAELIALQRDGVISSTIAKEVFARACADGRSPRAIVEEDGLAQISDAGELDKLVAEAIAANPKAVEDYRGGKEKALGAIVGHVMRASKGQANPGVVNDLVRRHLSAG